MQLQAKARQHHQELRDWTAGCDSSHRKLPHRASTRTWHPVWALYISVESRGKVCSFIENLGLQDACEGPAGSSQSAP